MKIILASVGKPHDAIVKEGIHEFTQRISKYFTVQWLIIPTVKNAASLNETALKKAEALQIANALQKEDYLVLLDEKGKNISSPQLANIIQQRANESCKQLVFLIGGAFGVDETIIQRANFTWSLSNLVFPHMLVRFMLAEQVYRACSILRNEKYHHQ
ncbi:MAG: 23S rRNA (pseudouridine(1915)-N(3))-methyltransferase RlmH [Chitinophagaceae bacterium]|jgi:23S rRNA (pseudouridine1915-N3)-methyltransferase